MSGDVQPRKRKDKKKKKDDLGIEEPRGTAAALGEGDIFMHSQHEHDTGGHWCAKVIFFSLLAVLITLIGLIILENRGLSELEANSVESRYSGVLEGWLEEGHDDDHHDQHTLDLHHHDDEDDDDDHSAEVDHDDDNHDNDHDDDDEHSQEDEDEENNEQSQEDDENEEQDQENDDEDEIDQEENDEDSQEQNDADDDSEENDIETAEGDEDEVEQQNYRRFYRSVENQATHDDDDDDDDNNDDDDNDLRKVDDNDDDRSEQNDDDDQQDNDDEDNNDSQENDDDDDAQPDAQDDDDDDNNENEQDEAQDDEDEDEHEVQDVEDDVEVEHIEKEVFDDEVSTEAREPEDDKSEEVSDEVSPVDDADEDEVEFLEPGDLDDLPDAMPIPVAKRPLVEVEDTTSTEVPQDTLADEEEYEKQQEALRKEKEEASQGIWLKLVVGGALLVATQAVLRRATAPREPEEVDTTREETPLSDRRMTLIPEPPVTQTVAPKQEVVPVQIEVTRQSPVVKSPPTPPPEEEDLEEEEEEDEEVIVSKQNVQPVSAKKEVDKELYSDEEDVEDEEEEEEIEPIKPTRAPIKEPIRPVKETPKLVDKKEPPKPEKEPSPEEEYEDDDVEIIEEEDVAEEDEEEISDVDDAELLNRLEAKYGRLPAADRPGFKKDGGNSIDDEWPGEPSDAYWRDELDAAERDLRQGEWTSAAERANAPSLRGSGRAKYIVARALDAAAEAKRDNAMLTKAIAAYLEVLKMNERLSDKKLIEVAERTLDRIQFRGNYLGAEPVYRLLIRRFPDEPVHRNNLTVSFLMANRVDLAEEVIKETLARWPNDKVALAHHGFILKTLHNKNEDAVKAFTKALEDDTGAANEPRFYYHFGDSLLLLGRFKEAHEVHKRGTKLGHFLSPSQRSLYNVNRLKSKPWWDVEKTPYLRLARALEKSWKEILKEGQAAQALYEKEKEGLKERGEWSQLDLFVRGREVPNRCARAPVTCAIVKAEAAASGCRRGQVKFSSMEAGTHVRPHVGPTNCRLRMHLGLSNTRDTYIRVDHETRQWQIGKVLIFDDSFEHEVWHNGTGTRLVLIVDVWHPDLTPAERRQLPSI